MINNGDNMKNEWKYTKSYATIANLEKALNKIGLTDARPIIVGIPETSRVTAMFQYSVLESYGINLLAVINAGFKVV